MTLPPPNPPNPLPSPLFPQRIDWTASAGWAHPVIEPYAPLSLDPCAHVLHYGNSCFEGMKAYASPDGRGLLFRPERNMARFKTSMHALSMPDEWDEGELLKCIQILLQVDRRWLPTGAGCSMYLRPFAMVTDRTLALGAPTAVTVMVILSPSAPYFGLGEGGAAAPSPIRILLEEKLVRAWPVSKGEGVGVGQVRACVVGMTSPTLAFGISDEHDMCISTPGLKSEALHDLSHGYAIWCPASRTVSYLNTFCSTHVVPPPRCASTAHPPHTRSCWSSFQGGAGDRKIAGNYAPTIIVSKKAKEEHACSQALYTLPSPSGSYRDATLSECGTMNIFLVLGSEQDLELVTPTLHNGTILPGVTRDSVLELARDIPGLKVSERDITVGELEDAAAAGRLLEVFGVGTAATVAPVDVLVRREKQDLVCARDMRGADTLARQLYERVTAIQWGRIDDGGRGWSVAFA